MKRKILVMGCLSRYFAEKVAFELERQKHNKMAEPPEARCSEPKYASNFGLGFTIVLLILVSSCECIVLSEFTHNCSAWTHNGQISFLFLFFFF